MKKYKKINNNKINKDKLFERSLVSFKKAQHEILGFVLIVVIVSIIGLIFLTITFRGSDQTSYNSIEISNLLQSAMHYTTDCKINVDYKDGQDLVKACYNEQVGNFLNCLDGRNVCDALETTMSDLIQGNLDVDEDSPNKAFKFRIYFNPSNDINPNEDILNINGGLFKNCSSRIGGAHFIDMSFVNSGTIFLELSVCKG